MTEGQTDTWYPFLKGFSVMAKAGANLNTTSTIYICPYIPIHIYPNTCPGYIEATILPEGSSIRWLKDACHHRHQQDMSCLGSPLLSCLFLHILLRGRGRPRIDKTAENQTTSFEVLIRESVEEDK